MSCLEETLPQVKNSQIAMTFGLLATSSGAVWPFLPIAGDFSRKPSGSVSLSLFLLNKYIRGRKTDLQSVKYSMVLNMRNQKKYRNWELQD